MKQKLKNNKGLTLMEMLCTVAIVVIMSALLVTGMALASNTLAASVTASEARVLCDTLTTRLCYYIDRDGYKLDNITITDSDGNEITTGYGGELRWKSSKLVPNKTYPAMAVASVTLLEDESDEESIEEPDEDSNDENLTRLKLGVYNRNSGHEYTYNIIEIQENGVRIVEDDEENPSTPQDSEQNAQQNTD